VNADDIIAITVVGITQTNSVLNAKFPHVIIAVKKLVLVVKPHYVQIVFIQADIAKVAMNILIMECKLIIFCFTETKLILKMKYKN